MQNQCTVASVNPPGQENRDYEWDRRLIAINEHLQLMSSTGWNLVCTQPSGQTGIILLFWEKP